MLQPEKKQFLVICLLTVVLSSIGFLFLHFGLVDYGYTFFILVPLCIGFFIGKKPSWKSGSIIALLIGLVAFFYLLITAQLEWFFCVVMLFPLILILTLTGMLLGWGVRKKMESNKAKNKGFKLSIVPVLILLFSATIEHYFSEKNVYNEVESKMYLSYPKEKVFDYIKSVDTVNTDKPFLLRLGLAIPQKCVLEKEEPGARRTCYFEDGSIEERVTEIKRGEVLKMDVVKFNLPGLKWLKFEKAIYLFETKGGGTLLTRITTYKTELRPRLYWKFWEAKAIEAEHEYVLNDLKRRLDRDAVNQP